MGKPEDLAIADVKRDIAAVLTRYTRMASLAVEDLTDKEIKEGFALPKKEAPAWTGLVEKLVSAAAKGETSNPTTVNNSLQLVMVGKAESTDKWIEQVNGLRKKRPVIDVPAKDKK